VAHIGINARNLITKDEDILGDWVNMATYVERFAGLGGICIPSGK